MGSPQKILIVEDDRNILKLIHYSLEKAGFECVPAGTGEDAWEIVQAREIDLVVLDIMLPQMDGFDFCRRLKQEKELAGIPVIMLTAKGEEIDRIVGLELGADDYMIKPFSPRELVLRVKAVLRRGLSQEGSCDIVEAGGLTIDVGRHQAAIHGKPVDLAPMEFKLLVILMQRKGRVQSREQLLDDVWGITSDVTTRTVDTHIKLLRRKLGKMGKMIETIRSVGYRFAE